MFYYYSLVLTTDCWILNTEMNATSDTMSDWCHCELWTHRHKMIKYHVISPNNNNNNRMSCWWWSVAATSYQHITSNGKKGKKKSKSNSLQCCRYGYGYGCDLPNFVNLAVRFILNNNNIIVSCWLNNLKKKMCLSLMFDCNHGFPVQFLFLLVIVINWWCVTSRNNARFTSLDLILKAHQQIWYTM